MSTAPWPVTVDQGTKQLAGTDSARIVALALALALALVLVLVLHILGKAGKSGRQPHLLDRQAAGRIVDVPVARLVKR